MIRRRGSISAATRQDITEMRVAKEGVKEPGASVTHTCTKNLRDHKPLRTVQWLFVELSSLWTSASLSIFGLATATWRTRRETNTC